MARRIASQLGFLLLINLAFTLGVPNISVGGHLGGLAGGVLCAPDHHRRRTGMLGPRRLAVELAGMAAVAVFSFVGAIAIA